MKIWIYHYSPGISRTHGIMPLQVDLAYEPDTNLFYHHCKSVSIIILLRSIRSSPSDARMSTKMKAGTSHVVPGLI